VDIEPVGSLLINIILIDGVEKVNNDFDLFLENGCVRRRTLYCGRVFFICSQYKYGKAAQTVKCFRRHMVILRTSLSLFCKHLKYADCKCQNILRLSSQLLWKNNY